MRAFCFRLALLAFALVALAPASADAQERFRMRVTLGIPPEFDVDLQYFDPSDLFARVKGSRVMPFWVSARNVLGRDAVLEYGDFALGLGNAGTVITLNPVDPAAARAELNKDAHLGRLLGALTDQGGEWGTDPFRMIFRGGRVRPGKEASGWVFFRRPEGVSFTGVMEFGTTRHARELLTTGSVNVSIAPPATRSGSTIQDRVADAINGAIDAGQAILHGEKPFGKSYAVLFGISDYNYRNNLGGAAQDVRNLSTALQEQGFDKVVVVVNRDVTADTLRNIQRHFMDRGRLQPDDRLLVYYAGHGDRNPTGDTGYIVLSESNPTSRSSGTEVSMAEFMSWMRALPVKHLLVILDACYSGLAIGGRTRGDGPSLDATNRQELYLLSSRSGRFVMTAGDETQRAHEDVKRWGGGLFTQGILRAIRTRDVGRPNDRLVTTFELFARAKQFVIEQVKRYGLSLQSPLLHDLGESLAAGAAIGKPSLVSRGEFVFVNVQ